MSDEVIKCECPLAGYCNRHKLTKGEATFKMCQTQDGFLQFEKLAGNIKEPNIISKILNYGKTQVSNVLNGFQKVSKDIEQNRLDICSSCPLNVNGTCIDCGCIIQEKVKLSVSFCPQGKWGTDFNQPVNTCRPCGK